MITQRAEWLSKELSLGRTPRAVESRYLFLAALRNLKYVKISAAQLATIHILDSAIYTLYDAPVMYLIYNYVDDEGTPLNIGREDLRQQDKAIFDELKSKHVKEMAYKDSKVHSSRTTEKGNIAGFFINDTLNDFCFNDLIMNQHEPLMTLTTRLSNTLTMPVQKPSEMLNTRRLFSCQSAVKKSSDNRYISNFNRTEITFFN